MDERYRCENAAEQHRLQNDDLIQQTRAANAASVLVGLTYNQSLMLLAGTIFGLLTLVAAFTAVLYAKRAAEAAERGLGHSEDTAKRQLRAYVSVSDFEVENVIADAVLEFSFSIKNNGQTPAYKVRVHNISKGSSVGPERVRLVTNMEHATAYVIGSMSDLGPGESVKARNMVSRPITKEEVEAVRDGSLTLVIGGLVSYRDAFGKFRRVIFRWFLMAHDLNDEGKGGLSVAKRNNRSN